MLRGAGNPLAYRSGDVAAILGENRTGGLACQRQRDERVGNVLGADFAVEQIAGHVVALADAARFRPMADHLVGQQSGANAVGIDGVRRNTVSSVRKVTTTNRCGSSV